MPERSHILVKRLCSNSLFAILLAGNLCAIFPLLFLIGVLTCFGLSSVSLSFNGHLLTGGSAIIGGILMGLIFPLLFSFGEWILLFPGLWIYSRFRTLRLEFIAPAEQTNTSSKMRV